MRHSPETARARKSAGFSRFGSWTDRALLVALGVYPLVAAVRAWPTSDDLIMVLFGFTALGLLLRGHGFEEIRQWCAAFANPLGCLAAAAAAYALLTLAWSEPHYPFFHSLKVLSLFAAAVAIAMRLKTIPRAGFHLWIAGATAAGLVLFGADGANGYKLLQAFYGPPLDRRINPNAVALSLLVWPSLAALAAGRRTALAVLFWLLAGVVIFRSPSQAALAGYAAGSAMLLIAWLLPRAGTWIVTVAAVGGVILAPALPWIAEWFVLLLPDWFLQNAYALPRIEIWSTHAASIFSAPLLGHGLFSLGTTHPHNFPLQIWVELGAAGVALTIALVVAAGTVLSRGDSRYRPFALAFAVAIYVNAYVSYGIWEVQFLSILLLCGLTVFHGARSVTWSGPRRDAARF